MVLIPLSANRGYFSLPSLVESARRVLQVRSGCVGSSNEPRKVRQFSGKSIENLLIPNHRTLLRVIGFLDWPSRRARGLGGRPDGKGWPQCPAGP
jgi:hypothetical protein